MENLTIEDNNKSPIKTIEKKTNSNTFLLKDLTSSLSLNSDQIFSLMTWGYQKQTTI